MKLKPIKTHLVRHMWETYAKNLLEQNPEYFGQYHNKIHNFYIYDRRQHNKEVASYTTFRMVLENFFQRAKRAVIEGEVIHIHRLGKICAKRVQRDFRSKNQKRINWAKTMATGKVWSEEKQRFVYKKTVYFTDDDWCRIAWFKHRVRNDSVYMFAPSEGNGRSIHGFKTEFNSALKKDPLLKYRYLYVPIRNYNNNKDAVRTNEHT